MSSTRNVQKELAEIGEEKNLRTIQRHMKELLEAHKIQTASYDRKNRRPLYTVWSGRAEYESIMDCPEISDVDWKKFPKEEIDRLIALWSIGKNYQKPWLIDRVRLILKSYTKNGDSKSLKKKINEIASIKKLDVFRGRRKGKEYI